MDRVRADLAVSSVTNPHASRCSLLSCLAPAALMVTGAGIGSPVAAQTAQPDAELIALWVDLDALERRIDALFTHGSGLDFEAADVAACVIEVDQRLLLDRICALTPTTDEGCCAVARSLALLAPDYGDPAVYLTATMDERLATTLARGMMGRAGA